MVDEAAFKQILKAADPQACPFDHALLSGCCACTLVKRHGIAERESLVCTVSAAQADCVELQELLRHNSVFAIRELHDAALVTHAQNMKILCGGLRGLQREVDGAAKVDDVSALVAAAHREFGAAEQFPYQRIVRAIVAYQPRKRKVAEKKDLD